MVRKAMKKFYKDFSLEELGFLEEIIDSMRELEVVIPAHVVQRLIEREIIPSDPSQHQLVIDDNEEVTIPGVRDVIEAWDEGIIYEFSNEAEGRTTNPYRVVIAHQIGDWTYFVKVTPNSNVEVTKILDVWKRKGRIPKIPPPHAIEFFDEDWDIIAEFSKHLKIQRYLQPAS